MSGSGAEHWEGGWGPSFEPAARAVLGALRSGELVEGTPYDTVALAGRFDVSLPTVRRALDRLGDTGLVDVGADDTVRFTRLSRAEWTESSQQLLAWLESAVRTAVPVLDDAAVERYRALVTTARTAAAHRDPALDPAFFDTVRFWAGATPNRLMARQLTRSLERLRFGPGVVVPWTVWDSEGWFAGSLRAAIDRDADAASRAAHTLTRLWDGYLATADVEWTVEDTGRAPTWGRWDRDDLWYDVLGAVRDGTFTRSQTYGVREVAARFRTSPTELRPVLRRLELLGLVASEDSDEHATVRITDPDVHDWIEAEQSLQAIHEACARWAIPGLDDDARTTLAALVQRAHRESTTRDYAFTATMLGFTQFYAAHVPNRYLRASAGLTIGRLAYILEHPPQFRQWDVEGYLAAVRTAAADRTPASAVAVGHGLDRQIESHIADVAARYESMEP